MYATTSPSPAPRFGGILWRLSRLTRPFVGPLAGTRWNPVFAIVEHQGRLSGRVYATPVAARRVHDGFVISLAFGAQVDWYRNLLASAGGTIRWREQDYPVGTPVRLDRLAALSAFHPVQRFALRLCGINDFIQVRDR